jgi:hypothetical protein
VKLFLFFKPNDRVLDQLIMKNLMSHSGRNTKTAMMFVIAMSFLIFAGCVFELMGRLIISQVESTMGGVDLYATTLLSPMNYLDEGSVRSFLEEQKAIDGAIEKYTFASTEMGEFLRTIAPSYDVRQRIRFGTACGYS